MFKKLRQKLFGVSTQFPDETVDTQLQLPDGTVDTQLRLPDEAVNAQLQRIEELAATRHKRSLPNLIPLVFAVDTRISVLASQKVQLYWQGLRAHELNALEQRARTRSYWGYEEGVNTLWGNQKSSISEIVKGLPGGFECLHLQLLSMHPSGYIREAAMPLMVEQLSPEQYLPFLLLRLNDWVPGVRHLAVRLIKDCLVKLEDAKILIENIYLITRLKECSRDDHRKFLDFLLDLMKDKGMGELVAGVASKDHHVARACFRIIKDTNRQILEDAIRTATTSHDVLIKCMAVELLNKAYSEDKLKEQLALFASDRMTGVRHRALSTLQELFPGEIVSLLEAALLDPSATIRHFARFYLAKENDYDFHEVYCSEISRATRNQQLACALNGLFEVGSIEDQELFKSFLVHESSRVRVCALRALASLLDQDSISYLLSAICDPDPPVSRAARIALITMQCNLSCSDLSKLMKQDLPAHTRSNLLILISESDKWDALPILLKTAASDKDERLRTQALSLIGEWQRNYNRGNTWTTATKLDRIQNAIEKYNNHLPERVSQSIDHLLQTLRRMIR